MKKLVTVGLLGFGVLVVPALAAEAPSQWYNGEVLSAAVSNSAASTPDQWYDSE